MVGWKPFPLKETHILRVMMVDFGTVRGSWKWNYLRVDF